MVIRIDAIKARYPGGWEAFAAQMGHSTTELVIQNYGKWIADANPGSGWKAEAL